MILIDIVVVVVLIATGCRHRRTLAIVGIGRCGEVGRRCCHRDIVVRCTRVARHRSTLVATRKDRNTTLDRTIGRTCIVGEVVERTLFERSTSLPLLLRSEALLAPIVGIGSTRNVAPTALQHYRSIVRRIFDSAYYGQRIRACIARKDLAHHNLHTIACARAASYRADTHTVIIHCRDHTRHVRAVSRIIHIVPRDDARTLHEVITVAVARIAIAVVVIARAPHLVLIDPDVSLQIGVIDKDTLVQHSHNHLLVARRTLPRALALHIGIAYRLDQTTLAELIASIHQVPLRRQQRVVHRLGGCACCTLCRSQTANAQWSSLCAIGTFDRAVEIDRLHLAKPCQSLGNLLGSARRTETHDVPLMQTLLARTLLGALVNREDALQIVALDRLQNLVHSHHATARCRATCSLRLRDHIGNLSREFDDHLALDVWRNNLRLVGRGNRLLFARRERHCRRQHHRA